MSGRIAGLVETQARGMWVTSLRDPDGYRVEFDSHTDAPEVTFLEGDGP